MNHYIILKLQIFHSQDEKEHISVWMPFNYTLYDNETCQRRIIQCAKNGGEWSMGKIVNKMIVKL